MNVPDEYLKALGKIVNFHAGFEIVLVHTVSRLVHDDMDLMLCILSGEKTDILLNKLTNIVRYRIKDENIVAEYELITKKLAALNDERNTFIHSTYDSNKDTGEILRLKLRRKARTVKELVDRVPHIGIGVLNAHFDEAKAYTDKLMAFLSDHHDLLRTNDDEPSRET